jgi:hypothetical protein
VRSPRGAFRGGLVRFGVFREPFVVDLWCFHVREWVVGVPGG